MRSNVLRTAAGLAAYLFSLGDLPASLGVHVDIHCRDNATGGGYSILWNNTVAEGPIPDPGPAWALVHRTGMDADAHAIGRAIPGSLRSTIFATGADAVPPLELYDNEYNINASAYAECKDSISFRIDAPGRSGQNGFVRVGLSVTGNWTHVTRDPRIGTAGAGFVTNLWITNPLGYLRRYSNDSGIPDAWISNRSLTWTSSYRPAALPVIGWNGGVTVNESQPMPFLGGTVIVPITFGTVNSVSADQLGFIQARARRFGTANGPELAGKTTHNAGWGVLRSEWRGVSAVFDSTGASVLDSTVVYLSASGAQSYAEWALARFPGSEVGSPLTLPLADADGDGLANVFEYGLGLDPNQRTTSGTPLIGLEISPADGLQHLTVRYSRPVYSTQCEFGVEVSDDFVTWGSGEEKLVTVSATQLAGWESVVIRDRTSVGAKRQRFMRLRATLVD